MTKFMGKILTGNGTMSCIVDGVAYNVPKSHLNYNNVLKAFKEGNAVDFVKFVNVEQNFQNSMESVGVSIKNDTVYHNNQPVHNNITKRLLDLMRGGFNVTPMKKFLGNALQNASSRAITEGFDFLDHLGIPLTDDGCFLAVKSVSNDFWSKTGGSIKLKKGRVDANGRVYNGIGEVIECERNQVDDRREHECSFGLHVGCWSYAGYGGWFNSPNDKVIIVKVNPKDIVSVPQDHNSTKMRVCAYTVVSEAKRALTKPVYSGKNVNDEDYDENEYDHDDGWDEESDYGIGVEDLQAGDYIDFTYTNDGESRSRNCKIEEIDWSEGHILGRLTFPENHAGEIRCFKFHKMTDITFDD